MYAIVFTPRATMGASIAEIRCGGKRGHWIWYLFPQLEGLGSSARAQRFALAGEDEAAAYLHDPELRSRLLATAPSWKPCAAAGRGRCAR